MGNTKDGRIVAKRLINLYLVLIFVLGVAAAVLAIHAFSTRGLFGYSARIVMSTSMEKDPETNVEAYAIGEIPARSFVLLELVPAGGEAREAFYAGLREGDVLTFVYRVMGGDVTITHRVRGIERRGGGVRHHPARRQRDFRRLAGYKHRRPRGRPRHRQGGFLQPRARRLRLYLARSAVPALRLHFGLGGGASP